MWQMWLPTNGVDNTSKTTRAVIRLYEIVSRQTGTDMAVDEATLLKSIAKVIGSDARTKARIITDMIEWGCIRRDADDPKLFLWNRTEVYKLADY